jgi:F420-non-reducing hydrogenase small subunit
MAEKIKVAVNWAAACGGCDVSLLDSEAKILDLVEVADVVYWPVAMDYKREDLEAFGPGEIDVGIFNGAIRTSEHAADALVMRQRCKVLVAYGACAAFGGIPGLANLFANPDILDTVYSETPSTHNPEGVRPQVESSSDGHALELPALEDTVRALGQVVKVDVVVPGCPPPPDKVLAALEMIIGLGRGASPPAAGTVLAEDSALCDACPRADTRTGSRMAEIRRPHEVQADPEVCFLEQGIVCLGMATRGGCGATCINVNMPCRGCFGPTPTMLDPAAEALSAIGSLAAQEHEDELIPGRRLAAVRSIADLAGTFYRFTLPSAAIPRRVDDSAEDR